MAMITNNDVEPIRPDPNRDPVGQVTPKAPIQPTESDRFSEAMKKQPQTEAQEASAESEEEISPEELQRQIREGFFKSSFQKSIERAREITKEMKE